MSHLFYFSIRYCSFLEKGNWAGRTLALTTAAVVLFFLGQNQNILSKEKRIHVLKRKAALSLLNSRFIRRQRNWPMPLLVILQFTEIDQIMCKSLKSRAIQKKSKLKAKKADTKAYPRLLLMNEHKFSSYKRELKKQTS